MFGSWICNVTCYWKGMESDTRVWSRSGRNQIDVIRYGRIHHWFLAFLSCIAYRPLRIAPSAAQLRYHTKLNKESNHRPQCCSPRDLFPMPFTLSVREPSTVLVYLYATFSCVASYSWWATCLRAHCKILPWTNKQVLRLTTLSITNCKWFWHVLCM